VESDVPVVERVRIFESVVVKETLDWHNSQSHGNGASVQGRETHRSLADVVESNVS